jgi:PAS domain S-box-containing protein
MKSANTLSSSKIAIPYLVAGVLWILCTENVLPFFIQDNQQLQVTQKYAYWAFIITNAMILFIFILKSAKVQRTDNLEWDNHQNTAQNEQKFRLLIENSMDAIAIYSEDGKIIFQSPAATRILGYSEDELVGKNALDFVVEEDRKSVSLAFKTVVSEPQKIATFELRTICKDKSIKWLEVKITNRLHEPGINAIVGNYREITERKNAENAIFEAEERYRMLVEKLPAVVFMDNFNNSQTTQYISPRIHDLLGYTPEEWQNGNNMWENSLHPDDKGRVLAEDNRTNQTGESFRIEYRLRHRDGHYVWIKEDASIVRSEEGIPLFWHGILVDITEQKNAEEALLRRDAILRTVGFSAEQFLQSTNWENCIDQVMEKLGQTTESSRVYIFKKEKVEGDTVLISQLFEWCNTNIEPQLKNEGLQTADMNKAGYSRWVELFNQGQSVLGDISEFPIEEQAILQEQGIRSLICIPIQTGNDWWGFIGFDECQYERTWSDVEVEALKVAANTLGTAINRQRSETLIQNSEASYRGLFNSVREAIYIQDENGKILDINNGALEMHGYPRDVLVGKTLEFLAAPDKNSNNQITQAIKTAFSGEAQEFESWGQRSNGDIFPITVRLFNGVHLGQKVVIAVIQDITTQKNTEEALQMQLRELSVLHAVALTASISRDIDALIQQITDIISDTLYSDNCGVLLLDETQSTLTPHYTYRGGDTDNIGKVLPITEGVSGMVVMNRRPLRLNDVSLVPYYVEISKNTRSELCTPIISGSKILGVLNVESKKINAFTERDERLLNTVSSELANAMERILFFELEKKRRKQAEDLREATLTLTSFFELDRLHENIFDSLSTLINYDSASIEIFQQDHFEIIAGRNIPATLIGTKYPSDSEKWGGLKNLRHPIIIDDIQTDDRFVKFKETSYIRGWMGVPLLANDKIIGFLNIDSQTPGVFNEESASIVQTFANQAAIAIENVRLFELEQRRRKEAETLRLATASLTNTLNINDLYETILDWLEKLVPFDSASIMIKQDTTIKLTAHRNLPESFHIGQAFPITQKWRVIEKSRKPLIIQDVQTDSIFEKWEGSEYIRGWMSIAMFAQDTLIGFINLDSREVGTYTEDYATPIQTFANQAAMAIDKARLFDLEKKRRESAEILRQTTTTLTNLLDLPSLKNTMLELLNQITPYDSASILEIEGDRVRVTAASGLPNTTAALDQTYPLSNALCKIMNATGKALIIDDCKYDPRFEKWGDSDHVRGWMGVPLTSRGQVIGYITIDSLNPNAFTQNDAVAAQTFAQQAATSLENVRLYTETRQRLDELELVSRISHALRAARDTKEMLPILLSEIRSSIGTDAVAIWLYDQEQNLLIPHATSGKLGYLPRATMPPNESIIGKVYVSGIPRISPEYANDPYILPENADFFGPGWGGISVPVRTMSETIGVLSVAVQSPQKIEAHHQRLLTTIAEIAGNALHRSTLYERSEEQIRRLTTLREMDMAITSSLDLNITLNIITEHLITKMGVSASAILVFNPDSQMLDYYAISGFKNRDTGHTSMSIGDGLAGQILLSRRAIYINDLSRETPLKRTTLLADESFTSYYAVPLFSKGITKGILETYFKEPFSPTADWVDFLQTLAGQATIAIDNAQLFENLQRTNQEISLAYDTTLEGWGKALELRDKETQGHTQRVTNLTLELARQIGIPESELIHIRRGALLHDIGKMGVPDNILRKPGPLTDEETAEMRKHPKYAFDLLAPIPYLRPSVDIPYSHHEWWNGSGYPRGLKGEDIPLSARIFAIIDVWDALLSDRPYRKAWDEKTVLKYINDLKGKQFDPLVVETFQKMLETEPRFVRFNFPPKEKKKTKQEK